MADQVFNVNSGFYDAINRDRVYSADDMNKPYKRIVANGVFATPAGTPSTDLQVTSSGGMDITVAVGEGLFGYKWFENNTPIMITVPSNSAGTPRIDSVIAQVDTRSSGRVGSIVYRTGTPDENPVAPVINTVSGVYEYRLANVYVAVGAATISGGNITDMRGSADCPWVTALIKQVDTSVLFEQYQRAYQTFYHDSEILWQQFFQDKQDDWNAFIQQITDDLSVNTNVQILTGIYVAEEDTDIVDIGIGAYDQFTDGLLVFQNGLQLQKDIHYTISPDGETINLKGLLKAGQNITFICLKSVVTADYADVPIDPVSDSDIDHIINSLV